MNRCAWGIVVVAFLVVAPPATAQRLSPNPPTDAQPASWVSSTTDVIAAARKRNVPFLIAGYSATDSSLASLNKVLDDPAARGALSGFACAKVDVNGSDDPLLRDMLRLPAMRVFSSDGRLLGSHDGAITAAELTTFLLDAAKAAELPIGLRIYRGDADKVDSLLTGLKSRDPVVRENSLRKLQDRRDAAAAIADLLMHGNLEQRLSALELLGGWGAPLDGIDPWHAQTLTEQRIKTVTQWAAEVAKERGVEPTTRPDLTAEELTSAATEIEHYLAAQSMEEALASRERLARLGIGLLPKVYEQLKAHSQADEAHRRLTLLRYRLVACDRTALQRSVLDRLVSDDAKTRLAAASELVTAHSPDDASLLLELLGHPDPMVREMALRALNQIPGPESGDALMRVLRDPEPNVRAAVLKQLAESPSPALVPKLVEYVATEKEPDLVVHTVRVFRSTAGIASFKALMGLADHSSWRVRAEVIDALVEITHNQEFNKPAVTALCLKKLDDGDSFVVARAMAALMRENNASQVAPMLKAAKANPSLIPEVIRMLANNSRLGMAATDQLKEFAAHPNADVRCAAITALAALIADACAPQVQKGLEDSVASVRMAACEALRTLMVKQRPTNGYVTRHSFLFGDSTVKVESAKWLEDFRAGTGRPAWMAQTVPALLKMLASDNQTEALAAAAPLAALGHVDEVMPLLRRAAKEKTPLRMAASYSLPWLPWKEREELFNSLITGVDATALGPLVDTFTKLQDARAAGPLWKVLENPDVTMATAAVIHTAFKKCYFAEDEENGERDLNSAPAAPSKKLVALCRDKAADGGKAQRVVALALLYRLDPNEAQTAADGWFHDTEASETMRMDGLQIGLRTRNRTQGAALAISALTDSHFRLVMLALAYLAGNEDSLEQLHGNIELGSANLELDGPQPSSTQAPDLSPPPGLTLEMVKPFTKSTDPQMLGYSRYLCAMLGDKESLNRLTLVADEQYWKQRIWRAVAASGDDDSIGVLATMYGGVDMAQESYELRQVYWTIRGMTGPKALAFRKTIRDKVGMERLR